MTASEGGVPAARRKWIYLAAVVVLIGLIIGGLAVFHENADNSEAQNKAAQLKSRLEHAGLPAPDTQVIADSLGTTGDLVCQDPSNPLVKARYQSAISNGAGGPGMRPVIADSDVVEAVSLAIATYCPDNLGNWLKQVRDLNLANGDA
jgi:hypothetical protein